MRAVILGLLCFVAGCGALKSSRLDAKWAPLEVVVEVSTLDPSAAVTHGRTLEVQDHDAFFAIEADEITALLLHEQEHARRQVYSFPGAWWWCFKYAHSAKFRWSEEQIGWRIQLHALKRAGIYTEPTGVADTLAHQPIYDGMVSYEDALVWVQKVLSE